MKSTENVQVHDLKFKPFISQSEINEAVNRIAAEIDQSHASEPPICLIILNGAFMFGSDLIKAMTVECEVHFVKLSSYEGTTSTGVIKETYPLEVDIEGRNIIIIEDIIDTGNTMHYYLPTILARDVKSVSLVSLLFKKEALKHDIKIDHIGFTIPNNFVVGYGLDYEQKGRQLPEIYTLIN